MAADVTTSRHIGSWPVAITVTTALFVVVYGWSTTAQLHHFNVFAWDFAIFDQGLWLLSHFHDSFVTVRGLGLFADHSSYVMVLLAPLYRIWAAPEALIMITVASLAAGIPISYALARSLGGSPALSALVAGGYLIHPAISWNLWEGFHPEVLAVPLVLGAVLLIAKQRDVWALALLAVALLVKEDVGVLIAPLGVYVAWGMGKRRTGWLMAGAGVVALAVNFAVILPLLSPTGAPIYADRYARFGEGVLGVARGVITHPGAALSEVFAGDAVLYAASLVLPIAVCLLAPAVLSVGIPAYLVNALSSSPYQTDIRYHYTLYLLVVVVLAAAVGAGRLAAWPDGPRRAMAATTIALSVVLAAVVGPGPFDRSGVWRRPDPAAEALAAAVAMVPGDAVVSAWDTTVPLLSHRREIYVFPVPWQVEGYGELEDSPPDPGSVEWVLVRRDQYQDLQPLVDELLADPSYEIVLDRPPVLLLHRHP